MSPTDGGAPEMPTENPLPEGPNPQEVAAKQAAKAAEAKELVKEVAQVAGDPPIDAKAAMETLAERESQPAGADEQPPNEPPKTSAGPVEPEDNSGNRGNEPILPPVAPVIEPAQPTVVDARADAFQAQATEAFKKDPKAEALANYYQERATNQRNVTALETQLSTLSADASERPLVQAQLDLAKAQDSSLESRAAELEKISRDIDAMSKKGNSDEQIALQQENAERIHARINAEALSQVNSTDLAALANLAKDTNNKEPWAVKLRELGITAIDFSDPKKVEEAQKVIKAYLDLQHAAEDAYKKNEKKLNRKAKAIDDAIRNGQRPYAEGLQGDLKLLKKDIDIKARENLAYQHPESAAILGITAAGVQESKRDNKEKTKEHKEKKKEQHINKPSLRNAWNQLTEAWKIAWNPKKSGAERVEAWKEIARKGFYIGWKAGARGLLFILLANLAVAVLTPVIALKKINDTFGGGH